MLAVTVSDLSPHLQKRALFYGLVGALVFRVIAISSAAYLLQWHWMKYVGGGYLVFLALKYFLVEKKETKKGSGTARNFWMTVLIVELMDIAFAVDSILTAVALSNKFWVILLGGFVGLVMMRFAASLFIKVLKKFPRFETSAYLLVLLIGTKLVIEGMQLPGIDFHSRGLVFWVFWLLAAASVLIGFSRRKFPSLRKKK